MQYEKIMSRTNDKIKEYIKIMNDSDFREENKLFCIEGLRLCEDALKSDVYIKTVFFTEKILLKYNNIILKLIEKSEKAVEISEEIAKKISDTKNNQGVFCVLTALDKKITIDTIDRKGKYIALEDINDPANLGTIIRTAEALGLKGLILSENCCDIYNPKVLRGSMGSVFRINFYKFVNFYKTIKELAGIIPVFGSVADNTAKKINEIDFDEGTVIIIGNEANGISKETKQICKDLITIPMKGDAESLNASMAAGILIWEMMK